MRAGGRRLAWRVRFALVVGFVLAAGALVPGCRGEAPTSAPHVVASIPPLALLAAEVTGDRHAVASLLPPGANPHSFEPTPSDVRRLRAAKVLVTIGAGFDDWAVRAAREAGLVQAVQVVVSEGLPLRPLPGETGAGTESGGARDPHVWLDPVLASRIVGRIGDALARVDPEQAAAIAARTRAAEHRLTALNTQIAQELAPARGAAFVATHGAWGYFARRYGLVEAAVIEPVPGREAGPRTLMAMAERARKVGARAVFTDVQLAGAGARVVAEQVRIPLVRLDPLGGFGVAGRDSYEALLRWNVRRIASALVRR